MSVIPIKGLKPQPGSCGPHCSGVRMSVIPIKGLKPEDAASDPRLGSYDAERHPDQGIETPAVGGAPLDPDESE